MWRGLLTYDADKNGSIANYLIPCVKNAMLSYLNSCHKITTNSCSLEQIMEECDQVLPVSNMPLIDDLSIEEVWKMYSRWLRKNYKNIDAIKVRQQRSKIILQGLAEGYNQTELERLYNINRTLINNIVSELRECLKIYYPTKYLNSRRSKNG